MIYLPPLLVFAVSAVNCQFGGIPFLPNGNVFSNEGQRQQLGPYRAGSLNSYTQYGPATLVRIPTRYFPGVSTLVRPSFIRYSFTERPRPFTSNSLTITSPSFQNGAVQGFNIPTGLFSGDPGIHPSLYAPQNVLLGVTGIPPYSNLFTAFPLSPIQSIPQVQDNPQPTVQGNPQPQDGNQQRPNQLRPAQGFFGPGLAGQLNSSPKPAPAGHIQPNLQVRPIKGSFGPGQPGEFVPNTKPVSSPTGANEKGISKLQLRPLKGIFGPGQPGQFTTDNQPEESSTSTRSPQSQQETIRETVKGTGGQTRPVRGIFGPGKQGQITSQPIPESSSSTVVW